jgi:hypothetical protein
VYNKLQLEPLHPYFDRFIMHYLLFDITIVRPLASDIELISTKPIFIDISIQKTYDHLYKRIPY